MNERLKAYFVNDVNDVKGVKGLKAYFVNDVKGVNDVQDLDRLTFSMTWRQFLTSRMNPATADPKV